MPILDVRSLTVLVAAIGFAAGVAAAEAMKVNVDDSYVAIGGYDTVAYFTLGKPTKGDPRFEANWQDARWQFVTAEHRDMFVRDPDRYAPRYGGFCAVGMARGYLSTVDPEAWRIVDGKLFLTFRKRGQEIFQEDIPGTIEKAEKNWQTLGQR
jgi:hypothetical protein